MVNTRNNPPADDIAARLKPVFDRVLAQAGATARIHIAFSGGLDSTALLLLAGKLLKGHELTAIHVNHGINPDSNRWQQHCEAVCRKLAISLRCQTVSVDLSANHSVEQACRLARYQAFNNLLAPGDLLLTAHHLQDQAETVLINLARGSGPQGLAGIPPVRPLGQAWVARPLLAEPRMALQQVVQDRQLSWIEDPSNLDPKITRGFLRQQVLPLLKTRWPAIEQTLGRSAELCLEAHDQLAAYAAIDLEAACPGSKFQLALPVLQAWTASRQRLVIRHWLAGLGLNPPDRSHVHQLLLLLDQHRSSAQGLVSWPGTEVRRYRQLLFASRPLQFPSPQVQIEWSADHLVLPAACGKLLWHRLPDQPGPIEYPRLIVRFQATGERLRPVGKPHHRRLKKLFQEAAIPPWQRHQLPFIYAGDELLSVGDLFWTERFEQLQQQYRLRFQWQH